jgi:hypothetical protein
MRSVDMRVCSPYCHSALIQKKNRDLGGTEAAVIRFFEKLSLACLMPRRKTKCDLALRMTAMTEPTGGKPVYSWRRASIGSINAARRAG